MKLSLQGRKQQKSKGEDAWFFTFFFSWHNLSMVGTPVHPEVQDWSAALNDSCLQNRLSICCRVFSLEELVSFQRRSARSGKYPILEAACLRAALCESLFLQKNSQGKSVRNPGAQLSASVMGSHFNLGLPGRREVFWSFGLLFAYTVYTGFQ